MSEHTTGAGGWIWRIAVGVAAGNALFFAALLLLAPKVLGGPIISEKRAQRTMSEAEQRQAIERGRMALDRADAFTNSQR